MTYRDPKTGRWAAKTSLVFVYGTLMRPYHNNRVLQDARGEFVGEAVTVESYVMLYAGYPYVVKALGDDQVLHRVKGEVWRVRDSEVWRLDRLEGYGHGRPAEQNHYNREKIDVELYPFVDSMGDMWRAFIYFGNPRYAARAINNPVLPNPDGLLVYPGPRWEQEDEREEA